MIQQVVDDIIFGNKSLEQTVHLINEVQSYPNHRLILQEIIELLLKKQNINLRDVKIFQLAFDKLLVLDYLNQEKQIFELYKQSNSVAIWIAIITTLMQNGRNTEKHRAYIIKNLKKHTEFEFWNLHSLQKFRNFIITREKQYHCTYVKEYYEKQIEMVEFIYDFFANNPKYISTNIDFRQIITQYIMMTRLESKRQKALAQRLIGTLLFLSRQVNLNPTFKYCFDYFRYEFDSKISPFDPQKPILELIQKLSGFQVEKILEHLFLGLNWSNDMYVCCLKNFIKIGLTPNIIKFIRKIKHHALTNKRIQPLLQISENQILKTFVYLKFEVHFKNIIELVKQFILGPPPRRKIYQKLISKAKAIITNIPSNCKSIFLNFLEMVKFKYQNTIQTDQLNALIQTQANNINYSKISLAFYEESLQKYDWVSYQSQLIVKIVQNTDQRQQFKGLINIGNSCYMNSFLQALYMTKEFRYSILDLNLTAKEKQLVDKLEARNIQQRRNNQKIVKQRLLNITQLQKLFALLYKSKRPYINPNFLKNILPIMFRNMYQQDSAEFGRIFLSKIQQATQLLYEGDGQTLIKCLQCKNQRVKPEKFIDLILWNDYQNQNIESLVKKLGINEQIENIECEICSKLSTKSEKSFRIRQLPNYLILTLNRFTYDIKQKKKIKLNFKIDLSETIHIEEQKEMKQFEIYSLIIHRGKSADSGHYFTFSKIDFSNQSGWVCFDDSNITFFQNLIKIKQFLSQSVEDTPYILFYQLKNHIERISKQKLFTNSFILNQKLASFIEKEDLAYLKENKKQRFTLPKITLPFFKKDEDDEDNQPNNTNYLIM